MGQFLKGVTTGRKEAPLRVILYGVSGIGKTTWASNSPSPIYMAQHGESDEIDVPRLPNIYSWDDAQQSLTELRDEPHEYKTFVLDTADWLEPLIWSWLCQRGVAGRAVENIEAFGYGKGYKAALDEWRVLLARLEEIQDRRGMNVIILAHSHVREFKNPEGDPWDKYEMKVHALAGALLKEWSKAQLFAQFETYTKKERKTDLKARAYGEGARIVHTQPRPAWDAKSRYELPPTMPLAWSEFEQHARRTVSSAPLDIKDQVVKLLSGVDDVTRIEGEASLKRCGEDRQKMGLLADWLRGRVIVSAAE